MVRIAAVKLCRFWWCGHRGGHHHLRGERFCTLANHDASRRDDFDNLHHRFTDDHNASAHPHDVNAPGRHDLEP